MLNDHELRREYVLDQAIAAGKFGEARRAHYAALYNRDPAGTEQVLAVLASATDGEPPYPRTLFPELARPRSGRSPTRAAALPPPPPPPAARPTTDDGLDALVAGWSKQLFPEAAAAGARPGRIMRAND